MKKRWNLPWLRSAWVLAVVFIILTGVSFAAFQSQNAALTGNTITSATADLRIGTSSTSFSTSRVGYSFTDVVPGGSSYPAGGNSVFLKNYGTSTLNIKAAINSTPSNLNNVDLTKVFIHLTRADNSYSASFSLKSLVDSYSGGGLIIGDTIGPGVIAQYQMSVSMSADAFSGSSATISGIDMVFSGVGV